MRLSVRITVVIACAVTPLLGVGGYLLLQSEERELLRVARAETMLLARSLQTAFENAIRDQQIEDVAETLSALATADPRVAVLVFDERGELVGSSAGARVTPDCVRVENLARIRGETVADFVPPEAPETLLVALELRESLDSSASSIVLERQLGELRQDLRETGSYIGRTVGAFVLGVAGLTWILSRRYIATPLQRLVENMRQVRRGDLLLEKTVLRSDEVGDTLHEFEMLVQDLEAARQRADQEQEARRRIEGGLERADKLITLGQLSAVMAHEIGSPLQVLEGRARALSRHADDAEATRRTAACLVEQTERIARIVSQMLEITRRKPPVRASLDVALPVRRVLDLLELEARRRQVELRCVCRGSTLAFADADQLQQVILNLVRNALDAAPPGSCIEVLVSGADRELAIEVVDQGPGIDPRILPHLGEPFFTTKAAKGGTGLGLCVVKSILREHGGRLEVESGAGSGCRMSAILPRETPPMDSLQHES